MWLVFPEHLEDSGDPGDSGRILGGSIFVLLPMVLLIAWESRAGGLMNTQDKTGCQEEPKANREDPKASQESSVETKGPTSKANKTPNGFQAE